MDKSVHDQLLARLEQAGYFPDLMMDSVELALGEEELLDFVVHHEPTFSLDEVRRHLTVLALTPTRLVVGHTDDRSGEWSEPDDHAVCSTEAIGLHRITNVAMTRVVTRPERYRRGDGADSGWLSVAWGSVGRIELEPAQCADPQCEADHGYSGSLLPDDLSVRMSVAADGRDDLARLFRFAARLQQITGRDASRTA